MAIGAKRFFLALKRIIDVTFYYIKITPMKITTIILFSLLSLNTFANQNKPAVFINTLSPTDSDLFFETRSSIENLDEILDRAEDSATTEGRKILEATRTMITNEEIIVGSCWDFINEAYNRSGFTSKFRKTAFKSKQQGPYADISEFQPGDWLYFINHSFGDIEHSSIFVAWTDKEKKIALMISYAGGNQAKPARYKTYDLRSVYNIIRGK